MKYFNLSAESADIRRRKCLCLSAVAEKTTGAVGNIVAATGLGKKDDFPTDVNVRMLSLLRGTQVLQCVHAHPQKIILRSNKLPVKSIQSMYVGQLMS